MDDNIAWERFLGRWGLITAALLLGLVVTAFGIVGFAESDSARGDQYAELLQSARAPIAYRVYTLFDGLGWSAIGVTLIGLGALHRRGSPVLSTLAMAGGTTQVVGALGGFLRMFGIGELGRQLAGASPERQVAVLTTFDSVSAVVSALFVLGDVLQGAAFLAVGTAVLRAGRLPRRLAYLLVAAGITSSILALAQIAGLPFLFPLLLLHVAVIVPAIGIGLALVLWQPRPLAEPSPAGASGA